MANQLKMADIQAILSLDAQGWSHRSIAARLGVHRETVSRYVRLAAGSSKPATLHAGIWPENEPTGGSKPATMHAPPGSGDPVPVAVSAGEQLGDPKPAKMHAGNSAAEEPSPPVLVASAARRASRCDPWRELIEAKVAAGLSAQRIYQDLVDEHSFAHSYSTVQRFVRRSNQARPLPFRRMECGPGEEAQVDFGTAAAVEGADGKRRRGHVLRVVLSFSRKAYSEVVERQTTEAFIRCLENAFMHFGGVPQTLVIDNLRAAVSQADWYEPELNPKLQSFAAHYGVAILPTRPRTPRHKGKVERGIGYVKGNGLKGRTFTSIAEQNRHLQAWETNVADCRIHGTTRRQVGLVFRELEQPALRPLPSERFPLFQEAERIVHRDGHVAVERAYYSAPPEHVGRTVWVRWDGRLVRIFNRQWQQIAVHVKVPVGKFSTQAAHVAAEKISGVERGAAWLLGRTRSIGAHAEAWAAAMLEARGVEGLRVLQGLLALTGKQGAPSVDEACRIAASYRAYRLRTVRALVERQAPRQSELAFTAEHPLIRNLADYGAIARRALAQTAVVEPPARTIGGRNQQDPQVPSPEPPVGGSSPTSFPSSLLY
ncbi:MAG TPA: IS21 family transposase [Pirellulales bacterium]|nr:IS21 family transposase [Pirellulales bacterium]